MSIKALFTLYRIAFAPALKPYRIGLLFTRNKGDIGAMFATERSNAPIFKVETHMSDRCSHYTVHLFVSVRKAIWYRVNIAKTRENLKLFG